MIAKRFRGISSQETNALFRGGRKARFENGTVYWCARDSEDTARIAVSIAKKATKSAVKRVLFRRKIQAAVQPLIEMCKSTDIMIVWATPKTPDVTVHREEIMAIFEEEGLLK